jgi:UDP-GlcNAc:undecaprenyl-phosphate/decaprenyl-phosphate GlcNAc-1-phosphate transferase
MLIALAANTINLLDLRPGRALFAFFCLATPVAFTFPDLIISPLLGALREVPDDTKGKAMLGDTGANLLGAVAGLALVVAMPAWARLLILALLITLNLVAERVSLSQKIQTTPWLRWIDSKLGVR